MKKLFTFLLVIIMTIGTISAQKVVCSSEIQEVVRNGNTFEVIQKSQSDVQTYLNWKDKDGIVYPIYITSKGACYVKRISKKTGKEYKYYLPKEVQKEIHKELKL